MSHPWIALAGIGALAALYVVFPVVASAFAQFRAPRRLRCPETRTEAEVALDAAHAAWTAAFRAPLVRVKRCSLWPRRGECAQGCLTGPEATLRDEASRAPLDVARP
jgi:hypothetical protein